MKNAPKTWLAVAVLVLFAILAVRQLTQGWTHSVPLSVDFTSLYVPPPLSLESGEVLDRSRLTSLTFEIRDEAGVTHLSFATRFGKGAPPVHSLSTVPLPSGNCVVSGTATFLLPTGESYDSDVQGTFQVDGEAPVSFSLGK